LRNKLFLNQNQNALNLEVYKPLTICLLKRYLLRYQGIFDFDFDCHFDLKTQPMIVPRQPKKVFTRTTPMKTFLFLSQALLLHIRQRHFQILNQILHIFNTYAQSNQRIGQPHFQPFLFRNRSMRHGGRMANQRFHTAQ
jgi:hypothetical protein